MTIKNPLIFAGKEWPYLSTNLAITSRYDADGNMDASVAVRFVPTRITDGQIETLDSEAITMFRGSLSELADKNEAVAMITIKNALETLIANKLP